MSATAIKKVPSQEEAYVESQMRECVNELVALCLENDELVFALGCALLKMGGIPRNYRYKQMQKEI